MAAVEQKGKRQAVWPGGIPKPIAPYSPAIKAGGWLFVAGQLASDFETGLAPECKPANPNTQDALRSQSDYVLRNLAELHNAAGMDMRTDVVRIYQWFASPYPTQEEFDKASEVQIPLPKFQQAVVDSQALYHGGFHHGEETRYALISTFESSPEMERWIETQLPSQAAAA